MSYRPVCINNRTYSFIPCGYKQGDFVKCPNTNSKRIHIKKCTYCCNTGFVTREMKKYMSNCVNHIVSYKFTSSNKSATDRAYLRIKYEYDYNTFSKNYVSDEFMVYVQEIKSSDDSDSSDNE